VQALVKFIRSVLGGQRASPSGNDARPVSESSRRLHAEEHTLGRPESAVEEPETEESSAGSPLTLQQEFDSNMLEIARLCTEYRRIKKDDVEAVISEGEMLKRMVALAHRNLDIVTSRGRPVSQELLDVVRQIDAGLIARGIEQE
jgi:hypothetical protein